MITTYIRSSSFNTHTLCPQQFYLSYVCGIPAPAGKAAAKGNIVHKALEILANLSKSKANGLTEYTDEIFGKVQLSDITPDWALDKAYQYYVELEPFQRWNTRLDYKDCLNWLGMALEHSNGYFDPRNLNVIEPELRFDLTIEEPWAHYEYETSEGHIEGQLGIKGTIDLVVRDKHNPGIIEIIDWKTGQRRDWAIEDEALAVKTYKKLNYDPQLLLYYYAASKLFPDVESIQFTIVYVRSGGPFRLSFGPEHLDYAEKMLRKKFEEIRDTQVPKLNKGKKCYTFCWFGKNIHPKDPSKTYCKYMEDEIKKKGIDAVTTEYGNPSVYLSYQDGGGRKAT